MKKIYRFIFCIIFSVSSLDATMSQLELHPQDTFSPIDNSKNVLQGIASYEKYLFTTQTIRKFGKDIAVLFNLLDKNGNSIANKELPIGTHSYDLSVEKINSNSVYLYTVGEHSNNALRFIVNLPSKSSANQKPTKLNIKLDKSLKLPDEYAASTGITLSANKKYLLAISRKYKIIHSEVKVLSGHINIYDKKSLLNGKSIILHHIPMIKEQEKQPIQGIIMLKSIIYTLCGNNNPNDSKMLILYHKDGSLLQKYHVARPTHELTKWGKWELEGLTIQDDYLITTINAQEKKSKKYFKGILKLLHLP